MDLDGLRGTRVSVAGGVRLADAGAIVAATVDRGRGPRAALVRLRHDGSVVEWFGRDGVAMLAPRRVTALTVTAGPRGHRIVVAVRGRHGATRLLGLDGHGRPRRPFGHRGSRTVGASGPVALVARGPRLAVASASGVAILDLASGATVARHAACLAPHTAVLDGAGHLIVAGDTGCGPAVAAFRVRTAQPVGASTVAGDRALVLGLAGSRDVCTAAQRDGAVRARRTRPARVLAGDPLAGAPSLAAADRLAGLAPDPRGGCNLLLTGPAAAARVVQTVAGGAVAKQTALPRSFRPGALFVCRTHVLTAGVRRSHGRLTGALAVVKRDG